MNDPSALLPCVTSLHRQFEITRQPLAHERNTNRRIRELLRFYGLRTSLIRLKVIEALLIAAEANQAMGARELHASLGERAAQLSLISIREVLRRLCEEDVIYRWDKRYRFTTDARGILQLGIDGDIG